MEGNGAGGMEEFKGGAETEGRDGTWNVYLFICFEHIDNAVTWLGFRVRDRLSEWKLKRRDSTATCLYPAKQSV